VRGFAMAGQEQHSGSRFTLQLCLDERPERRNARTSPDQKRRRERRSLPSELACRFEDLELCAKRQPIHDVCTGAHGDG
jgi:hypothetical protein